MVGACGTYRGEDECGWRSVWKCEGKNLTWKTWHGWEKTIKMDHKAVGWEGVDLITLPQDRDWWHVWLL
jgi:hypothetical protein